MILTVQIATPNPLNGSHGHWRVKAQIRQRQKNAIYFSWLEAKLPREWHGERIRLTRLAPRQLDGDNLQAALKSVRDAVAACLGMPDDRADVWDYGQEKSKQPGVRIEI